MTVSNRLTARKLCSDAISRGDPLGWFEELYHMADSGNATVPWADLEPNPNFLRWHKSSQWRFEGQRCLVVGCGLGDDCEYLRDHGGVVTGFDVSSSAINTCKQRFPDSSVTYTVEDLFDPPAEWRAGFDFVLESYTLQVLPTELRNPAMTTVSSFVASGGALLVISRGRDCSDPEGEMPWPLTKIELQSFCLHGLNLEMMSDYMDSEEPSVRRFVARFRMP